MAGNRNVREALVNDIYPVKHESSVPRVAPSRGIGAAEQRCDEKSDGEGGNIEAHVAHGGIQLLFIGRHAAYEAAAVLQCIRHPAATACCSSFESD